MQSRITRHLPKHLSTHCGTRCNSLASKIVRLLSESPSPATHVRRQGTRAIHFLTQDELRRLFKVIRSKRDKAMFLVAYRHGLRASEIGLLQLGSAEHLDFTTPYHGRSSNVAPDCESRLTASKYTRKPTALLCPPQNLPPPSVPS